MTNCTITNESEQCSTKPEYVGYMYVFTPVAISGVVLNILNLLVFTRTPVKMNQSTFMFLVALAVADLGAVLLVGPIGIVRCLPQVHEWELYARSYYEAFIFLPIGNSCASASVYLTVVVSVERYICVKYTTLNKRLNKKWMTQSCIAVTALVAFGMNSPYLFDSVVNGEGEIVKTEFGRSEHFHNYVWARLVLNKIVPIIIVAVSNALLVTTVVASSRHSKTLVFPNTAQARRQRQQTRLTIMMMGISIMFVLCHLLEPFSHGDIYRAMFGPCSTLTPMYRTLTMVTNTLETLSYSTNFVFYCIFHRQFHKGLKHIICCCLENRILPKGATSVNGDPSGQTDARRMSLKGKEKYSYHNGTSRKEATESV